MYIINFARDLNFDFSLSLSPQFLSVLSFCRYSVSVDTQFLSILSFCRYSVPVDTQFLSILSFCRYSVSVDAQFLSILRFCRCSSFCRMKIHYTNKYINECISTLSQLSSTCKCDNTLI